MWRFLVFLLGHPVRSQVAKRAWAHYWRPRRLTLKSNPAVYRWLFWNFSWDSRVVYVEKPVPT